MTKISWLFFLVLLTGCAARKPRVYNDTCDLCVTVRRVPPHRPAPPRPGPRPRGRYILAFDRPHVDCVELEHKPGTDVRLWACPEKPEVPRVP